MSSHKITNHIAVDDFLRVKIADLDYSRDALGRPDDCGALYVAPVIWTDWDAPRGLVSIYATTNGDPINVGQIEDGVVTLIVDSRDWDESLNAVLRDAEWVHRIDADGYSYLVEDAVESLPVIESKIES